MVLNSTIGARPRIAFPLLIWILVERFQRHLPSGFVPFLVRDSYFRWLRMFLSGAAPPSPPRLWASRDLYLRS